MVAFVDLTFSISSQSKDVRGVGRWYYISITGKQGVITTFITCY